MSKSDFSEGNEGSALESGKQEIYCVRIDLLTFEDTGDELIQITTPR